MDAQGSTVVFAKGDYAVKTRNGTVTMTVPRDIGLEEIRPSIERMVRDAGNAKQDR